MTTSPRVVRKRAAADAAKTFSRQDHRDPGARAAEGTAARIRVPLARHAEFDVPTDRTDPVDLLIAQGSSRLPELLPVRYGRMLVSPFAFYRGAANVMAADLAATPVSGFACQLSGDAHLSNFGAFGSPERRLIFDINDFDETHPGPWEWDVKRLAASLVVAARDNSFPRKTAKKLVLSTVRQYREAMAAFAAMGELQVWYARADLDELGPTLEQRLTKERRKSWDKAQARARTHDSLQAMTKLTALVDGHRRIVASPPLVVPVSDLLPDLDREHLESELRVLLEKYRRSLPVDRRHLFGAFQFVDMARKAVGVGSVGTRCWIILLRGRDDNDPLLLQVKEAQRSVLADHVRGSVVRSRYRNEGQRVVSGQRLMQAVSDIFLGWETVEGIDGRSRDFYVRQLRDWKGSAIVEDMDPVAMTVYAQLCGWTLARAHARTGDRISISAYLGDTAEFDQAIAEFARRYADQNERDYDALVRASRTGRVEVVTDI